MYARIVPQVLEKYDVRADYIGAAQKGYRSESYPIYVGNEIAYNLLFFKKEPNIAARIQRADTAAKLAAEKGLPVRVRRDERLLHVQDGVYAGLYNYLPGNTVPWEAFTKKHIKLLGMAMGSLHTTWQNSMSADNFHVQDELIPLLERMAMYFQRSDVQDAMAKKLGATLKVNFTEFRHLVKRVSALPGQQIIHMDLVRGNILFSELKGGLWCIDSLELSGVIDFEKAATGHPLFDIARTLAFLLVDSPKPNTKIYQYFLDSGYVKRGGMSLPDARLLTPLLHLFLLHDFYKFLRHTPYESLSENHHYMRTCVLLHQYGMISLKS